MAVRLVKWLLFRQRGDGDKILLVCVILYALFMTFVFMGREVTVVSTIITLALMFFPVGYALNSLRKWVKNRKNPSARNKTSYGRQETQGQYNYYEQAWQQQEQQRQQEEYARQQAQYEYEQHRRQQQGGKTQANYGADNPFEILGVNETTSESDVRTAYRDKCRLWHPDKLSPEQKKDPKFNKMVNEEMGKINTAYEQIKQSKGWR
jgi:uncharacterized protein YxeA